MGFITADLFTGPESLQPSTFLHAVAPSSSLHIIYYAPAEIATAPIHTIKEFAMTPDGHRMVAAANYSFFFGGGSVLEIYDNVAGTNGLIQVTTNTARPRGVFASPRFSADGSMVFFTSNSPDLP